MSGFPRPEANPGDKHLPDKYEEQLKREEQYGPDAAEKLEESQTQGAEIRQGDRNN